MSTETDRELLELAAKAAGYVLAKTLEGYPMYIRGHGIWDPLLDDGDALRLVVKLDLLVDVDGNATDAGNGDAKSFITERHGEDPYAATRRAIVRAAAEIGMAMP